MKTVTKAPLSNQRQLVELLDPEPILGYLLQNGALLEKDVEMLESETSQARTNLLLLKCVESNGERAQNLLVNALRQTGQLHLANLMDQGIRIKRFTGSGYLSKKRHQGQLSLSLVVKALKFDQDSVLSIINPVSEKPSISREWVSVDDICHRISVLSAESQTKLSSSLHIVESPDEPAKKSSCFCGCFANLFMRRKKKASKAAVYLSNGGGDQAVNLNNSHATLHAPNGTSPPNNHYVSRTTTHITATGNNKNKASMQNSQELRNSSSSLKYSKTSIDNLRSLLDMFRNKADEVFTILQESQSSTRDGIIKYFEQTRGMLVLDTEIGDETFLVNSICTKSQQVEQLRRDMASGRLSRELEGRVATDEVMDGTGLLGIKLKVVIKQEEVELVEQELDVNT